MLSKLFAKLGLGNVGARDGTATVPRRQAAALLQQYVAEVLANGDWAGRQNLKEYAAGREILALPAAAQAQLAIVVASVVAGCATMAATERIQQTTIASNSESYLCRELAKFLLRQKLPFAENEIQELLQSVVADPYSLPIVRCAVFVEEHAAAHGLSPEMAKAIDDALKRCDEHYPTGDLRKLMERLKAVRSGSSEAAIILLTRSEYWSAAILDYVSAATADERRAWSELLAHAAGSSASKPTKKWLAEARSHIDRITPEVFRARLLEWFAIAEKGGRHERPAKAIDPLQLEHLIMDSVNAQTLKGLVWAATLVGEDDAVVRAIGGLGVSCYRKIPWIGARSTAVANACVWALGAIPGDEAIGQLSIVRMKSKYRAAKQGTEKALAAAAAREGVAAQDLEEKAIPTLGLTEVGRRDERLGEFTVELVMVDTRTVDLRWKSTDGKVRQSVPAVVKRDFADELKALKATQKALKTLVPAQRTRLERLYLDEKSWPLAVWRERYLDHRLVGALARRLIWKFTRVDGSASSAIWHDGKLVDENDQSLDEMGDELRVELWHPVHASASEVLAWREWLERHEVTQPFKQAHREIYVLTDAERETETYSNRFAAHVIRQHQFAALASERGWQYRRQGNFDSHNTPFIDLPHWNMRIEFWVEPADIDEQSGSGIFSYLSTDQVRFYRLREDGPMRLADVPALVFTEMMRDVDLFVGVASVGTDPTWADGGPNGRYQAYWQAVSFGELAASAKVREDVIARLIPRLKIAERCSLEGNFLVVRGDIRTYKIHLGSGNILMTPNDMYLCIVPGRGMAAKQSGDLFLPFEGDSLLSEIISKALLLANDTKITDPTIMRQIGPR